MAAIRTSAVQKQILKCLVSGLKNGRESAKSTTLNFVVDTSLTKLARDKDQDANEVKTHPNNFRKSCEKLEERGLIIRWKEELDWFVCITPDGIDFVSELQ